MENNKIWKFLNSCEAWICNLDEVLKARIVLSAILVQFLVCILCAVIGGRFYYILVVFGFYPLIFFFLFVVTVILILFAYFYDLVLVAFSSRTK